MNLLVMVLLTLAMSASAFAHRAPSINEEALRAFLMAGGTLDDLCGGAAHEGQIGDHCPLCRLDDPTGLAAPMVWPRAADLTLLRVLQPIALPLAPKLAPARHGEARAPPGCVRAISPQTAAAPFPKGVAARMILHGLDNR